MTGNFEVWDANDPDDYDSWLSMWRKWPEREVGAHPAYGDLFKGSGDRVLCASYVSPDNGSILYSFILREIPQHLVTGNQREPFRDTVTPYGYGGPHTWNVSDVEKASAEFWKLFDDWAHHNNIVSEFIRFGLFPHLLLPYPGDTVSRSTNIIRSLEIDDEAIFQSFEKKVRKNVRKAERSGLRVEIDEHGARIDDFLSIYSGTMERRNATNSYRFPRTFFESIHDKLSGHFAYAYVLLDNTIISTELLLVSELTVYSFLGGTDGNFFEVRPNDLLKHEVIRWARSKGKTSYVLGGGALPNDGIERYKRSFAPDGAVDFTTGQRVLQPDAYQQLVKARQTQQPDADPLEGSDFFPEYRKPL